MERQAFLEMVQSLLPQGQAWTKDPAAVLTAVLNLIAYELYNSYIRSQALLDQVDPRKATEMLAEWEALAGLPDLCTGIDNTIQERQISVHRKVTGKGGQSRQFFNQLALDLGYEIELTEFRPFVCGLSECGGGISSAGNLHVSTVITDIVGIRFYWNVEVNGPRVTFFRCGVSECGKDPLAKIRRADDLECLMNRYKPSHTDLTFAYEGI